MARTRTGRLAVVAVLLLGPGYATPARAAPPRDNQVPGDGVARVSAVPHSVAPGSTLHLTVDFTQTTPYPLRITPLLNLDAAVPLSAQPEDVTVRVQNPGTGAWSSGAQTVGPWGYQQNLKELRYTFPTDAPFELPVHGHLVAHVDVAFGSGAPLGLSTLFTDYVGDPVGAPPNQWVLLEWVGQYQQFQVGTPPPPTVVPAPPRPRTTPTVRSQAPAVATPATTAPVTGPPSTPPATALPSPTPRVLAGQLSIRRSAPVAPVAGGVGVVWLALLGGYLYRARRRRQVFQYGRDS